MSLLLMLASHLLISRHLFSHVVGIDVLLLLLLHDRRRPNRGKVAADDVIAWQTTHHVHRLMQKYTVTPQLHIIIIIIYQQIRTTIVNDSSVENTG